ncbi:MAG: hypothetical protein IRZ16_09000 [Myxococcaceae bacterium]|nr:hypothetical protein [Myxococcaceae bacterium]
MKPMNSEQALTLGYGVFPIVAGADKFTNLLCQWEKYLSPLARRVLPMRARTFMRLVGVIEMGVGVAVLSPKLRRYAAYVASAWLASIAANLVLNRDYDIAARDAWLALGALALAQIQPAVTATAGKPRLQAPQMEPEHAPAVFEEGQGVRVDEPVLQH